MRLIALLHYLRGTWLAKYTSSQEAEHSFLRATRQAPKWAAPWGRLALLYKKEKNWPQMLRCSQACVELTPRDRVAWWNLGIAATALDEWAEVRRAWKTLDIATLPGSQDPAALPVAVRVDPQGCAEVVYCSRLDPARAIIHSVPLPGSGRRFGDLVLHDGAPVGLRILGGKEIPIFDELELLTASNYATWQVTVTFSSPEDVNALVESAQHRGLGAENWSNPRWYVPSRGPGWFPEPPRVAVQPAGRVLLGFGAPSEQDLRAVLEEWVKGGEGRRAVGELMPVNSAAEACPERA